MKEKLAVAATGLVVHLASPEVVVVLAEANLMANLGLFLPPDLLRRDVQTGIDLLKLKAGVTSSVADED